MKAFGNINREIGLRAVAAAVRWNGENNERIVPCAPCGTEGRIYERALVHERNAAPHDDDVDVGPCTVCEGTGGEIVETELIDDDDYDGCFGL